MRRSRLSMPHPTVLSIISSSLVLVVVVVVVVVVTTLVSNPIRVESFSSVTKRNNKVSCYHPTKTRTTSAPLYRPLCASFVDDDDERDDPNKTDRSAKSDIELLKEFREGQLREAVLEDQFLSKDVLVPPAAAAAATIGSSNSRLSSFVSLSLVGQAKLPLAKRASDNDNDDNDESKKTAQPSFATVLVVAPGKSRGDVSMERTSENKKENKSLPVMFLPLPPPIDPRLRLLSQAYAGKPISSFSNMIQWNLNLINRDDSLFDNIPWNQWSKDPDRKNRDAAGNLVDEKFRYGKRDAYNRFVGKDVNAKTVAESKRRYWQKILASSLEEKTSEKKTTRNENEDNGGGEDDYSSSIDSAVFSQAFLSKRVLELRIQELRIEIADVDSKLAIARTSNDGGSNQVLELEETRAEVVRTLNEVETRLNDLLSSSILSSSSATTPDEKSEDQTNFLDKISRWALDISMKYRLEQNDAPYRGATGYAPRLSADKDDADVEFYRSPFDLLNEILSDQLNAEVIECVLENTSWLDGTIALGGAVVLRRRTPNIEKTIMGERLRTPDRDEDFGNLVKGGKIFVVECDVDEAIGVAISNDLPVRVERTIFEASSMMGAEIESSGSENVKVTNIKQKLPFWKAMDSGISLDVEGDPGDPEDSRLSPISIPRTTSSLFDSIFEGRTSRNNGDSSLSSSMFPNDNPIKSINQLDSLGNKGKAKTLLEMSNFSGRLPRPRLVRKAPPNENPLDRLLIPLIDESVRNEYNIREAERRGDFDLAQKLKAKKSKRQKAKEQVEAARREGNADLAQEWETEAEFLESLRADVTQDEGSYSRFLDKDDWYERDRQRTANRAKRSSFGNLLDGIE